MQVETTTMDPRIAAIHYRDYRHKVRAHREERKKQLEAQAKEAGKELGRIRIEKTRMEKEDEQLMLAYAALKKGERLLNLPRVLRKTGVFPNTHLPKLGICRADWKQCYFQVVGNRVVYSQERYVSQWGRNVPKNDFIFLDRDTFPAETWNTHWRDQNQKIKYPVKALVPAIPPHLRPAGDLRDYHILWEAEWKHEAPVDPLLLKQINETMFVVLAQWDLTPLEQQVLEGRHD